jgi:hypothetical protein
MRASRYAALIRCPLGVGEIEMQGDGVECGEESPSAIADRDLVDSRPDDVEEMPEITPSRPVRSGRW